MELVPIEKKKYKHLLVDEDTHQAIRELSIRNRMTVTAYMAFLTKQLMKQKG